MRLFVKIDMNAACKKILQEQFDKYNLSYEILGMSEIDLKHTVSNETIQQLNAELNGYGIEIVESYKAIQVQKIKDAIIEMVYFEEDLPSLKTSDYLVKKLNLGYTYLFNLFSETTFSSIENYIILQKIERSKELITTNELTFTEIANRLNYSSVAHFSKQFKNTTGLTPSAFQRIITKRRKN